MSENPLLPDSKLRELHALMLHCRMLERARKQRGPLREALLAATAIHLQSGDLVSAAPEDRTLSNLTAESKSHTGTGQAYASLVTPTLAAAASARLLLSAAAARGIQTAGSPGIVVSLCRAGAFDPEWKQALEWACSAKLPLLTTCIDATGGAPFRRSPQKQSPLTYTSMITMARRWRLPVLTVDGEDAVAMYRVMQECVHRARMGDGPAVIWAVLTPPAALSPMPISAQPLARLRRYMAARKIARKA
ncbi:MAG: thiamine pyrophosphate-dependent enzyme [Acidobacteriaceae bacterium]